MSIHWLLKHQFSNCSKETGQSCLANPKYTSGALFLLFIFVLLLWRCIKLQYIQNTLTSLFIFLFCHVHKTQKENQLMFLISKPAFHYSPSQSPTCVIQTPGRAAFTHHIPSSSLQHFSSVHNSFLNIFFRSLSYIPFHR